MVRCPVALAAGHLPVRRPMRARMGPPGRSSLFRASRNAASRLVTTRPLASVRVLDRPSTS